MREALLAICSVPADYERAGVSMEFLSATALRAIPVTGHFAGRRDYAVIAAYLMPIDMIADKRGLVVNAGIKLGYRLPGMRKYLPAFRIAGAGGSAGPKP